MRKVLNVQLFLIWNWYILKMSWCTFFFFWFTFCVVNNNLKIFQPVLRKCEGWLSFRLHKFKCYIIQSQVCELYDGLRDQISPKYMFCSRHSGPCLPELLWSLSHCLTCSHCQACHAALALSLFILVLCVLVCRVFQIDIPPLGRLRSRGREIRIKQNAHTLTPLMLSLFSWTTPILFLWQDWFMDWERGLRLSVPPKEHQVVRPETVKRS